MKTKLFTLMAVLFTACMNPLQAQQQLPNGELSVWVQKTIDFTTYSEPADWYTLNVLSYVGYTETTIRTNDGYNDTSAALLESKVGPFSNIPGLLTSGLIVDSTFNVDFEANLVPFQSRPTAMEFYFKGFPAKNDTNAMQTVLTKWNKQTNKRDTIAEAGWLSGDTVAQYTKVSATFNYFSNETPDSISILFSSSLDGFQPKIGSKLYLDDISLSYTPNAIDETADSKLKVYPNPANELLAITGVEEISKVDLYDISGRIVIEQTVVAKPACIKTNELSNGTYILKLTDKNGSIYTEKIIIKH